MSGALQTKLNVIRGLGLVAAASIVVGNMVGQGVFLKTRVMTCNVETPGMVMAVWVVAGLLTLAGALTLAELAAMMPKSRGIYVFLHEAYGARWGFLYSWMHFVIGSVSVTILGMAFAIFLNMVTGGTLAAEILAFDLAGRKVGSTPGEIASVTANSSVATEAAAKFLGLLASKIMAAALIVSVLGTLQISNMMLSRLVFAMSRDGLFFRALGEVSSKTRVPVRAVVAQALWAMVLVFFGSYDTLTDFYIFALWIFYGLAGASIFVFRRKMPNADRPYRTLGFPLVPALFLMVTVWLLVNTLLTSPIRSIIGLVLIALGLPFYWYRQKRNYLENPELSRVE